jgi:hypothetical protein
MKQSDTWIQNAPYSLLSIDATDEPALNQLQYRTSGGAPFVLDNALSWNKNANSSGSGNAGADSKNEEQSLSINKVFPRCRYIKDNKGTITSSIKAQKSIWNICGKIAQYCNYAGYSQLLLLRFYS